MNKQEYVYEVESKYLCHNETALREFALARGYAELEIVKENDVYFVDGQKEFVDSRTCLRVRERAGTVQICYKGPSSDLSHSFHKEEINIMALSDSQQCQRLICALGYKKYVTVSKTRRAYTKNEGGLVSSIVIDRLAEVADCYVECEVLALTPDCKQRALEAWENLLENVMPLLGNAVNQPYRDIVASVCKS